MQAEGYRRARNVLTSRRDAVIARALGFAQAFLLVAVLGMIALFVSVLASRGEARFPLGELHRLPPWVIATTTGEDARLSNFKNSGVFAVVARSLLSDNIVHRASAEALMSVTRVLPSLRSNV